MDLILWRHAEAQDGSPDAERELTRRGRKQAAEMAAWLKRRLPEKCRILVSPATRTVQTAAALGRKFETVKKIGVHASPEDLLLASGWPDSSEAVLIVGHQPTLGLLAARLFGNIEADWSIKKGAVWWFESRSRGAGQQAILRAVMQPDLV